MATSVPDLCSSEAYKWLEFWKGKKARHAVFTVNNYSPEEVEALREYGTTTSKYLVFGYEIAPTTGTPHLQCFVCWENPRSIIAFRDAFTKKAIHIEVKLKGTHRQASDYCKKPETKDPAHPAPGWEEFGECPAQGSRTDWCVAFEQIKSGTPVEEVVESQPQLLPCIRALDSLKTKLLKPKHRNVNVIVLWGDSGTGKSRWAYDNYPDLYSKPPGKWWDGYTGQSTVLLDDYYGYIPYTELLNVLDRYPYHAEIKGGYVWAQWSTVILTSNKSPHEWYRSKTDHSALKRRIHKIFFYSIDASPTEVPFAPPSPEEDGEEDSSYSFQET